MMPNNEQVKSLIRWVLAYTSGGFTGWLSARNILTADQLAQVGAFFASETVVSLLVGLGAGLWGLLVHTQKNAVAVVAKMPEVKTVEVEPTAAGIALKTAVGSTVAATVTIARGPRG